MPRSATTKSMVAGLLVRENAWISGERISELLGISRAAVAKHITSLRKEGYLIDAASRRGYFCRIVPDNIDVQLIRKGLRTKALGRADWLCLPQAFSTNQEAILRAAEGSAHGSIVLALNQTGGRGRKGRSWFSPPRSLAFSVILRPAMPAEKLPWLMIAAASAVHKTLLDLTGLKAGIKWPNDVCINGKKCSGILVEAGLSAGDLEWAVVGVGLNVNAAADDFPEGLRAEVTSIFEESGLVYERNTLSASLINDLDYFYNLIGEGREKSLAAYWMEASGLIGHKIKIALASGMVEGRAIGLNEDGRLTVKRPGGQVAEIESGDILTLIDSSRP